MDFGYSNRTPRGYGQQPLSNRPQSGRSNINPITGDTVNHVMHVVTTVPRQRPPSRPNSRPSSVPGLNLKCLVEEEPKPFQPGEVYDFSILTPDSASTVSWGTGRSLYSDRFDNKQKSETAIAIADVDEVEEEQEVEEEDEILVDNWTKERYSTKQLLKKMDKENLLEYNKKQKLVETVLADQLSRYVISDPDQNQSARSYVQGNRRGTNRRLHDSKVTTRGTVTENLLARRVQFGARIVTRNGHDALRELNGFFFDVDNSLTIYEFKQFGKCSKAIPFINRGKYQHLQGSRVGQAYTKMDIQSGFDILIATAGQATLPASLTDKPYIKFRVINVTDDDAGQGKVDSMQFASKEEYQNMKILRSLQDTVSQKLRKRGIKTYTSLGRWYRRLDQDKTGLLTHHELEQGLIKFHLELQKEGLDVVMDILDPNGEGSVDYTDYMHTVIREMNEYRKSLVRKAFGKIDSSRRGFILLCDIRKFYNTTATARATPGYMAGSSAIQSFIEAVCSSDKQEEVSYVEFEEYYEGLSIGITSDEDFANVMRNTWTI